VISTILLAGFGRNWKGFLAYTGAFKVGV